MAGERKWPQWALEIGVVAMSKVAMMDQNHEDKLGQS
jgi:hypothetical protein